MTGHSILYKEQSGGGKSILGWQAGYMPLSSL